MQLSTRPIWRRGAGLGRTLQWRAAHVTWLLSLLVLLLQRTPVLRVFLQAEPGAGLRAGQFLRAMLPAAAALGTAHTLTGQSMMVINPASPIAGTVGQPLAVAFAFTGASVTPESYAIIGTLPPGLSVPGATGAVGNRTLNGSLGTIEGTPSTAGTYNITIEAFDGANRTQGEHGSSGPTTVTFNIATGTSPPAFTTHPQSQAIDYGGSVTFTVAVTGQPTPTLQWRKGTDNIAGATGLSLTIDDLALTDAGSYTCVATNSSGSITSNPATLTVNPPAAPQLTTAPIGMTSLTGSGAFFAVVATGVDVTYQWRKDGADLAGATQSSLFLANVTTGSAGDYSVRVSNPGGSFETTPVPLAVVTTGRVRLANLSARARIGTGDDILIPGFIVGGDGDKTVLVRAIGPKLGEFGVPRFLADPTVQLFRGPTAGELNDDWQQFSDQTLLEDTRVAVAAFALTPSTQPLKDSSMVVSLEAGPTNYTVKAQGVGDTTGVGLVEFYDADPSSTTSRFVNISARAVVGTESDILIPGFIIEGDVAVTLLIRAVGPTLGGAPYNVPGVLADPVMTLFRIVDFGTGASVEVTDNDDWGQSPNPTAMEAARVATFAFELNQGSADAAMLVAVPPGGYTVKVEGKNQTTGVALMEIYLVGP